MTEIQVRRIGGNQATFFKRHVKVTCCNLALAVMEKS